jgi:hypothetical protein
LRQDTTATYLVKVAAKMIAQVRAVLRDCLIACRYLGREKLVIWDLVAIAIFSPAITSRW